MVNYLVYSSSFVTLQEMKTLKFLEKTTKQAHFLPCSFRWGRGIPASPLPVPIDTATAAAAASASSFCRRCLLARSYYAQGLHDEQMRRCPIWIRLLYYSFDDLPTNAIWAVLS
ncbi:hypothetical protein MTO96_011913 [Rhipicephalus appendiculatus]